MSKNIWYKQGKDRSRGANETWYRGETCNFIAHKVNLKEEEALDQYVLYGWMPDKPFIDKQTSITAFGSCFAMEIRKYLSRKRYNVLGKDKKLGSYIVTQGAGINNTFVMRQQFEWAFLNRKFKDAIWFDDEKRENKPLEEIRLDTYELFKKTDVFIMTLGLSEIWYNKETNDVFWRAIPKNMFDPKKHGFRISTYQENLDNLKRIYSIIRRFKSNAKIVFTLSPVPLIATFRPVSCITANCVSKSILRVAVDELVRENKEDKNLFYFPSYEIVKEYFTDAYQEDNRHIKKEVVDTIMNKFSEYYLVK